MSGVSGHKIPMLSMPLVSGGLSVNAEVHDQPGDSLIPPIVTSQRNGDCFISQPITARWNHRCQVSANHVNLLRAWQGLHHAVPAGEITEGFVISIASREAGKQPAERHLENMLQNDESRILTRQNLDPSKQLDKKNCTVSQPHSVVTVAMPGLSSNPRSRVSKVISSQKRRARISKGVKALGELFPNPIEGGQLAVLDDVIDYIKFLKLQLKALSQSRLGGEATSDPFIFLEGYGHYLFLEQLKGDPLEDIMGELMETDLLAAIQLLDSKGLSIIPMALANDLLQTK